MLSSEFQLHIHHLGVKFTNFKCGLMAGHHTAGPALTINSASTGDPSCARVCYWLSQIQQHGLASAALLSTPGSQWCSTQAGLSVPDELALF
jgi:hypothetical protein